MVGIFIIIYHCYYFFFNFRWRQLMTAKKCNIGTGRVVSHALDAHVVLGWRQDASLKQTQNVSHVGLDMTTLTPPDLKVVSCKSVKTLTRLDFCLYTIFKLYTCKTIVTFFTPQKIDDLTSCKSFSHVPVLLSCTITTGRNHVVNCKNDKVKSFQEERKNVRR